MKSGAHFPWLLQGEIPALEVDGDGGAFARGGLDGDGVAQLAEGAAAEIQADAGGALVHPAQLAGVAPLKHPGQVLRSDAQAGVLDDQGLGLSQADGDAAMGGVLTALDRSCSRTKRSHFSSVRTEQDTGV